MSEIIQIARPSQIEKMKKVMFIAMASLGIVIVLFGSFYPVGYFDAENASYAGYGHHSFMEIAANGFDWETNAVPVNNPEFEGSGPYLAMPAMRNTAFHSPFQGDIYIIIVIPV